jgi:hypothetical protein
MQISPIRREAGQSRAASWPRSNGIQANFIRASASLSRTLRAAENVVAFYKKRGIKEGKGAIKWTRLSGRSFAANAVRLQLHALAYNLGNFLHTLATPEPIKHWSLTTLKERLIKISERSDYNKSYRLRTCTSAQTSPFEGKPGSLCSI